MKSIIRNQRSIKVQFDGFLLNELFRIEGGYLAKYDKAYPSYQYYDAPEYEQLADKLVEEG